MRLKAHKSTAEWFFLVRRHVVIEAIDRFDSFRLETIAIKNEKPLFNLQKITHKEAHGIYKNFAALRKTKKRNDRANRKRGKQGGNSKAFKNISAKSRSDIIEKRKRLAAERKIEAEQRLNVGAIVGLSRQRVSKIVKDNQ